MSKFFHFLTILFISLFLGAFSHNSFANHIMGGEIQWESMGNDSFKISVIIYRDCNGCTFSVCDLPSLDVSSSCTSITKSLTLLNSKEVTPVCQNQCTRCTSPTCGFKYGIMRYEFITFIDVSDWRKSNCCAVTLSTLLCNRSASITTGAANSCYYNDAFMDICLGSDNNSPKFSYAPENILHLGKDYEMNPFLGYADRDSTGKILDSLVFSLDEPMISATAKTSWQSGYNGYRPLYYLGFPKSGLVFPRGFNLDSSTGLLQFRPMKSEVSIIKIKVEEYRKGELIGIVRTDFQVIVEKMGTDNDKPYISGVNCGLASNFNIEACIGDEVDFTVCTSDKDKNDSLKISVYNLPVGAVFSNTNGLVKQPSGQIQWILDSAAVFNSPFNFRFRVQDNFCPVNAWSEKVITVFIKNKGNLQLNVRQSIVDSTCGKVRLMADNPSSAKISEYYWMVNDTLIGKSDSIFYNVANTDTQFVKLIVKSEGCFYSFFDTILPQVIKPIYISSAINIPHCANEFIVDSIKAKGGSGVYKYSWMYEIAGAATAYFDSTKYIKAKTVYSPFGGKLHLQVYDSKGCSAVKWIAVAPKPSSDKSIFADTLMCTSDSFTIELPLYGILKEGKWFYNHKEIPNKFISKNYKAGKNELLFVYEDSLTCIAALSYVSFGPNPILKVARKIDICLKHAEVPLKSNYPNTVWKGDMANIVRDSFFYNTSKNAANYKYIATFTNAIGCKDTAHSTVRMGADTSTFDVKQQWRFCNDSKDTIIKFTNLLEGIWTQNAGYFYYDTSGTCFIDVSALKAGDQYAYFKGISNSYWQSTKMIKIYKEKKITVTYNVPESICASFDSLELLAQPTPQKWIGKGVEMVNEKGFLIEKNSLIGRNNVIAISKLGACQLIDTLVVNLKDTLLGNVQAERNICVGDSFSLPFYNKLGYWLNSERKIKVFDSKQKLIVKRADTSVLGFKYILAPQYENDYCNLIPELTLVPRLKPVVYAGRDTLFCLADSNVTYNFISAKGQWFGSFLHENRSAIYTPSTKSGLYKYTLVLDNKYGCRSVDAMMVSIGKKPRIAFSAEVVKGEAPLKVNFNSSIINAANYTWYFGTGDSAINIANPSYTYQNEGSYSVLLSASDSFAFCRTKTLHSNYIQVDKGSGIHGFNRNQIAVYPNPSLQVFILENKEKLPLNIRIYNMQGQLLEYIQSSEIHNMFGFDYAKGLYQVQVVSQNQTVLLKTIVKE